MVRPVAVTMTLAKVVIFLTLNVATSKAGYSHGILGYYYLCQWAEQRGSNKS